MRKNLFLGTIFWLLLFTTGCIPQTTAEPSVFPLNKGITWVYSYEAYEPTTADPNQIIKATYQLTETVVETKTVSTYLVAHVKREHKLIDADAGWTDDFSSQPNEFWYVVNDHQVLQSNLPLDTTHINIDELIVDYEFPLSMKKSWCLFSENSKGPKKTQSCEVVGRREVTSQGPYETPAGNFEDCYDLIDYFNGGNLFQKFCGDVGIVSIKFDHAGTRFGFEQTLISYTTGAP
jgi:hypothetical protein